MLDVSLSSEQGFAELGEMLTSPLCQFILWGCLAALSYHLVAGVRHLIMDVGIGESLEGGMNGAKLVVFFAVVLIVLAGVWVW